MPRIFSRRLTQMNADKTSSLLIQDRVESQILSSSGIPFSFLEIGMKTSLASERTGGIACPTLNSPTFTRLGAEFVGQAFSLPSPPSGLFSCLQVPGKLLKLGRVESQILRKNDEDRHSGQAFIGFRGAKPHHNRRGSLSHKGEEGFAIMLVMVMAAAIAITLYTQLPRLVFEGRRVKEEVLVVRGNEYVRAIQLYQRKLKKPPQTIDDLENTNQIRFLRRRYVDPFTGKDDWRLIHSNNGQLTDSLVKKPTQPGQPGSIAATTGLSASNTIPVTPVVAPPPVNPTYNYVGGGTSGTTQFPPGGQRRASETAGFRDPNNPNNPVIDPNNPPDPNNPSYGTPGPVTSNQPGFPGSNIPPGFLPPGVIPQPGQRFPSYPTGVANSQNGQQPYNPYPNLPNGGQPPNQTPLSGADNPALRMIQGLLTTPNPNGAAIAAAATNTPLGAGIAGIASKYDNEGIKLVNDRSNIKEWEFIYDQTKDKSQQKTSGPGQVGTPIGPPNTNNTRQNTGFGLK